MKTRTKTLFGTMYRGMGRILMLSLFVCGAQVCRNVAAHASSIVSAADSGKTLKQDRKSLRLAKRRAHALKANRNANLTAASSDLKTGHVKAAKEAENLANKDEQKLKNVRKNIRKDKQALKGTGTKTTKDDWGH